VPLEQPLGKSITHICRPPANLAKIHPVPDYPQSQVPHATQVHKLQSRTANGAMAAVALSAKEMEALWSDLASSDSITGFKAVRMLAAAPAQSLPFLCKKTDFPAPSKEVTKLVAELDSKEFVVREQATAELLRLGKPAVPALQRMLDDSASEEARLRLKYVLEQMGEAPSSPPYRPGCVSCARWKPWNGLAAKRPKSSWKRGLAKCQKAGLAGKPVVR
jgi:hypothetical protein